MIRKKVDQNKLSNKKAGSNGKERDSSSSSSEEY
jgi:hypothetical protein